MAPRSWEAAGEGRRRRHAGAKSWQEDVELFDRWTPGRFWNVFFFVFLRCVWWVFFRFFGCFLLFLGSVFVLNGDLCACSLFFVLRYSNLGSGAR